MTKSFLPTHTRSQLTQPSEIDQSPITRSAGPQCRPLAPEPRPGGHGPKFTERSRTSVTFVRYTACISARSRSENVCPPRRVRPGLLSRRWLLDKESTSRLVEERIWGQQPVHRARELGRCEASDTPLQPWGPQNTEPRVWSKGHWHGPHTHIADATLLAVASSEKVEICVLCHDVIPGLDKVKVRRCSHVIWLV